MQKFLDDDEGYSCWIGDHPAGFVLNVRREPSKGYAVLHRAVCSTISRLRDDGAYTGREYSKVVADDVDELRAFSLSLGRTDEPFSGVCKHCDPMGS